MSEKPINKFNKAQEDRRKAFVSENNYVADDVVSAEDAAEINNNEIGLKSIIEKKKDVKAKISITIDADTDEFYMRLGRIVGVSKSKLMAEVLAFSINTNSDIQEMAQSNKKIKKILEDFNKGFY